MNHMPYVPYRLLTREQFAKLKALVEERIQSFTDTYACQEMDLNVCHDAPLITTGTLWQNRDGDPLAFSASPIIDFICALVVNDTAPAYQEAFADLVLLFMETLTGQSLTRVEMSPNPHFREDATIKVMGSSALHLVDTKEERQACEERVQPITPQQAVFNAHAFGLQLKTKSGQSLDITLTPFAIEAFLPIKPSQSPLQARKPALELLPVVAELRLKPALLNIEALQNLEVGQLILCDHLVDEPIALCVDKRPIANVTLHRHHQHYVFQRI